MMKKILSVFLALAMLAGAIPALAAFPDTAGHWAEAEISALAAAGVVDGYPDGGFRPDAPVTRAEFAKIICELYDFPVSDKGWLVFDDAAPGEWYVPYLPAYKVLVDDGLTELFWRYGAPAGWNAELLLFDPQRPMTRIEAAQALDTVTGGIDASIEDYLAELGRSVSDGADFGGDGSIAVLVGSAIHKGFMVGDGMGRFRPYDNISRAEVCTVLSRTAALDVKRIRELVAENIDFLDRVETAGFLSDEDKTAADGIVVASVNGEDVSLADWRMARSTYTGSIFNNTENWKFLIYNGDDPEYKGMTWGRASDAEALKRLKVLAVIRQKAEEYGLGSQRTLYNASMAKPFIVDRLAGEDYGAFLESTGTSGYAFDRFVYSIVLVYELMERLSQPGGPCAIAPEELTSGGEEVRTALIMARLGKLVEDWASAVPAQVDEKALNLYDR